jgi:hypothetical protein
VLGVQSACVFSKFCRFQCKRRGPKMSNINCCIVGCHTTARRCPALSFLRIPKAGKDAETNMWRAELIRAVNRCDSSFNPDNVRICSRHFDPSCLKYGKFCWDNNVTIFKTDLIFYCPYLVRYDSTESLIDLFWVILKHAVDGHVCHHCLRFWKPNLWCFTASTRLI